MNKLKLIYAAAVAAISSIVFAVVITIWSEVSVELKTSLKTLSGHHWTSKSILTMIVFFLVMLVVYQKSHQPTPRHLRQTINVVTIALVAGFIILLLYYVNHYF